MSKFKGRKWFMDWVEEEFELEAENRREAELEVLELMRISVVEIGKDIN